MSIVDMVALTVTAYIPDHIKQRYGGLYFIKAKLGESGYLIARSTELDLVEGSPEPGVKRSTLPGSALQYPGPAYPPTQQTKLRCNNIVTTLWFGCDNVGK